MGVVDKTCQIGEQIGGVDMLDGWCGYSGGAQMGGVCSGYERWVGALMDMNNIQNQWNICILLEFRCVVQGALLKQTIYNDVHTC